MTDTDTVTSVEYFARFVALAANLTPQQIAMLRSLMQLAFHEGQIDGMNLLGEAARAITKKEDTAHEDH